MTQKITWKITKNGLEKNGREIAFFTRDAQIWALRGYFGEVYGEGATRMEAAKIAVKDQRLGKVPAGGAR